MTTTDHRTYRCDTCSTRSTVIVHPAGEACPCSPLTFTVEDLDATDPTTAPEGLTLTEWEDLLVAIYTARCMGSRVAISSGLHLTLTATRVETTSTWDVEASA